jgi:DNA-binding LytR/AlgR family response regulator
VKIDTKEIIYVEALADYVTLFTAKNKYTIHSTMKGILTSLPSRHFQRVHNSYIIRLDKIVSIEDNCVSLGEKLIPISRSKMKDLIERLKFLE